MEGIVSGAVGILTGCCAWGLLSCEPPRLHADGLRDQGLLRLLGGIALPESVEMRLKPAVDELLLLLAERGRVKRGAVAVRRLDQAEGRGLLLALCTASALLLAVLTGAPAVMLPGVLVLPMALSGLAVRRAKRAEAALEAAMPEAFGALAVALGSGHSLVQAMRYVGGHAQEPVRSEFMRVGFSIGCGTSAAEALDGLMARLPAPGLDLVSLALKVSQRTGAPLAALLSQASQLVGERIELARKLDVKTSQARMSAQLVACMPVGMIVFLALFSSDFQRGLATPMGLTSVVVALALNGAAWSIIRRIMTIRW